MLSVENPVLLTVPGIVQLPTNARLGLDTSTAIRAVNRQNWDLLYIDYIQDAETLALVMQEALTGQVVTTMHLKDAISMLLTIREWGAKSLILGDVVALITAQRLVRRLCTNCREPQELTPADREFIDRIYNLHGYSPDPAEFYTSTGCDSCHDGFRGRIGIFESLSPSSQLESALNEGAAYSTLRQSALRAGMETICLDGIRKAAAGITSLTEIRRVTSDLVELGSS